MLAQAEKAFREADSDNSGTLNREVRSYAQQTLDSDIATVQILWYGL